MSECFYCEDGEKRKSLMIEICKLNYSTIYLNRNQKYPGRCVVKLNEHKTEYFQMTKEQRKTATKFATMADASFFGRRYLALRYGFLKSGLIRNAGLFFLL